jgi:hypothetical protein
MDVNDYVDSLNERGALAFFASRLAPTEKHSVIAPEHQPLPRSGFCIF